MMKIFVRETPFKVFKSLSALQNEFPNTSFPREPKDLTSFGLEEVVTTPAPVSYPGDTVTESFAKVGGVWTQQWQVDSPADLSSLKTQLKDEARRIAERKMDPPLTSTEVMAYQELYRLDADPTPDPADYPLIAAFAAGRQLTNAQAIAAVRNNRQTWLDRAVLVTEKLHDVLRRVDLATTTAELEALRVELESY